MEKETRRMNVRGYTHDVSSNEASFVEQLAYLIDTFRVLKPSTIQIHGSPTDRYGYTYDFVLAFKIGMMVRNHSQKEVAELMETSTRTINTILNSYKDGKKSFYRYAEKRVLVKIQKYIYDTADVLHNEFHGEHQYSARYLHKEKEPVGSFEERMADVGREDSYGKRYNNYYDEMTGDKKPKVDYFDKSE